MWLSFDNFLAHSISVNETTYHASLSDSRRFAPELTESMIMVSWNVHKAFSILRLTETNKNKKRLFGQLEVSEQS